MPFEEGAISPLGPVLLLRPPGPEGLEIFERDTLRFHHGFKPVHQALRSAGYVETGDENAALVLVFVTRNRAETLGLIADGFDRLDPEGWLVVDGAKADGVDAIVKQVRARFAEVEVRARDHGKVFWLRKTGAGPVLDNWQDAAAPRRNADGYLTRPGLFSSEGIDKGSAALVRHFRRDWTGRAADLGGGWGYLSERLLATAPGIESLDLFEAEQAAVEAARQNVPDPRARVHWADVPRIPTSEGPFDIIVSNPPFHTSRAADPELGRAFIRTAARLLAPKGSFVMVANRQLPYEDELGRAFTDCTRLEEAGGFKIIRAGRPRKP